MKRLHLVPALLVLLTLAAWAGNEIRGYDVTTTLSRGCKAYNDGAQSIGNSSTTAVTFDTESYDEDGWHSTVTDTNNFTVTEAGVYTVAAGGQWDANGTGERYMLLQVNDSSVITSRIEPCGSGATTQTLAGDILLAASDVVELKVNQNSGGSLNIGAASSAPYSCWLTIRKVSD